MEDTDSQASPWGIYALLVVIALSIVTGRIASVSSKEGDTPFLSANDRSRWCTIAALVENGTYEIDPFLERTGAKRNRRPWYTIDLVRHRGSDGQLHYYSSKPPLLPTMIAGVYWCVTRTMGMWLSDQPMYIGRVVLWLVNVPTLAIFFLCTIASIDRVARTYWARLFLAAAVCFGTMMMPFAISLNNHLPAAAATSVVLFVFVKSFGGTLGDGWWLLAGLAGGFTAANELPALSMTVFWACLLLLFERRGLIGYSIGVAVVAAAFFATNWIAHESLRPPYAHRGDGEIIATLSTAEPESVRRELISLALAEESSQITLGPSREPERSRIVIDEGLQLGLIDVGSETWELRHWDDWYDYPGSYWVEGRRRGVDLGEPSRAMYAAHMTVGHYGIFSLTPLWLLMPLGLLAAFGASGRHTFVLAAIALATVVCCVFYVMRPEIDRNYGGVSTCFRWLLWFAPLWLFASARPADWLAGRRWGQTLLVILLALSTASMSTALSSPWQSPWLYRFWAFLGWINA